MILKEGMARRDRLLSCFSPAGTPEGRRLGFVFLIEMGKTVAGAVEMWESRRWRFPRAGGGGGKLDVELGWPITRDERFPPPPPARHFHSASVGAACHTNRGGTGDSILHWRSSLALAALIFFAHSVSLMAFVTLSRWAKLIPGFR